MILKVQSDSTSSSVLVYNESRDVLSDIGGDAAKGIIKAYGLLPLSKIYIDGWLDGELLVLGPRVDWQEW